MKEAPWWRDAVIYQIYPRSFSDADGDGIGDLKGITSRIEYLKSLGIDAVWISPFYPSPGADAGYDVADYMAIGPEFGSIGDFDQMISALHSAGIRLIMDIVPNHCSVEHPLFRKALLSPPGSAARKVFHFRDGNGEGGELPPNNWQSHFGGSAWTRVRDAQGNAEQWYLHLFDPGQPDFNWDNPLVSSYFEEVLKFWLDKGVDGFRIDVAHLLFKDPTYPDWDGPPNGAQHPDYPTQISPMFGLDSGHAVYRRWRTILNEYDRLTSQERAFCGEVCVQPLDWQATWCRPDELHTLFNFSLFDIGYDAAEWEKTIKESLEAFGAVEAPTIWVFSNHDVVRPPTRLGYAGGRIPRPGDGVGPLDPRPDLELGRRRARSVASLLMGLPGSVYVYQGEELGLPDNHEIANEQRIDPTFYRNLGAKIGRDGCRSPMPWQSDYPALGFSSTGKSWLPQPEIYESLAVSHQELDDASALNLYRRMIKLRKKLNLGRDNGTCIVTRLGDCIYVDRGDVVIVSNFGDNAVAIASCYQAKTPVHVSMPGSFVADTLEANTTVWLR